MQISYPSLSATPDEVYSLSGRQSASARTGWRIEAAQGTKRTLYYHFENKDALVAAVLDSQNELALIHSDLGYIKAAEETARKSVGNARPG
jgi:hypothetical protein